MRVLSGIVNIYDLSGGKTMPYWLKGNKRRELLKKNPDLKNRKIDIIQDFVMPDISTRIIETVDGQYIMVAGEYPPRIKCFDTAAHSLKFERGIDNRVIDMLSISNDYSKLVILEEDRYLELHNKGGRSLLERLPRLGTQIDYHYSDCDVYISTTGPEIDIFNLNEGRMKKPLITKSSANNALAIHPDHHKIIATGSVDSTVELWDPQNPQRSSGIITINQDDISHDGGSFSSATKFEVTSLRFNNLTLAVGTKTGQVLLYDMRARKPYSVTDHSGETVKCIKFHSSRNIMTMSTGYLKIWNYETRETMASITSNSKLNDLCSIDNTGMIFMAADHAKIKAYFLPSLGDAPKWCSQLDALVEELQEDETREYEDYIHVSEEKLSDLNLNNNSDGVIATINGFKVRSDIYHKMIRITNQLVQEEFIEKKVKKRVAETNRSKLPISMDVPKVNVDLHTAFEVLANTGLGKEAEVYRYAISGFPQFYNDLSFSVNEEDIDYSMLSHKKDNNLKRKA